MALKILLPGKGQAIMPLREDLVAEEAMGILPVHSEVIGVFGSREMRGKGIQQHYRLNTKR